MGVDVGKSLGVGFRGDYLARYRARRVQHSLSFLLDIEGVVLAGELSELVRGIVQVLLRDLEALLEKHAFAVRGRSRELENERVQLVDIRARQGCGSIRTVIRHVGADD